MRLSIQVDSGATPYSARIPSVELWPGAAAVVTTVAVGNSNWCGEDTPVDEDEDGEEAEAAEDDEFDDDEGDGADLDDFQSRPAAAAAVAAAMPPMAAMADELAKSPP